MKEIQKMQPKGFRQYILKEILDEHTGISTLFSELQGRLRFIVPSEMRRDIFQNKHNIDHSGKKAILEKIDTRHLWHGINHDVKTWVKICQTYQKEKTQRHAVSKL